VAKARDYDREMALRTQADIDDQNTRHKARRKMINKVGKKAVAGKDVHHKSGLGNHDGNLSLMGVSKNRSLK
jgi:hypothetical protein